MAKYLEQINKIAILHHHRQPQLPLPPLPAQRPQARPHPQVEGPRCKVTKVHQQITVPQYHLLHQLPGPPLGESSRTGLKEDNVRDAKKQVKYLKHRSQVQVHAVLLKTKGAP